MIVVTPQTGFWGESFFGQISFSMHEIKVQVTVLVKQNCFLLQLEMRWKHNLFYKDER